MIEVGLMPLIITACILFACYVGLIQAVHFSLKDMYYAKRNIMLIDTVVTIMFMMVCIVVGLLFIYAAFDMLIIYGALGIAVFIAIVCFVRFCFKHRWELDLKKLVIFVGYFFIVLYITIITRLGFEFTSVITTPFDDLAQAIVLRDPTAAIHVFLNVLLFIPFGYLIPAICPKYFKKWSFAMLGGLMTSTVIEGLQLVFYLGQSDIDDIIANTIGAVIGYACICFVMRVQENWKI